MRFLHLLPLSVVASAIVIPDEQVIAQLPVEDQGRNTRPTPPDNSVWDHLKHDVDGLKGKLTKVIDNGKSYIDEALAHASETEQKVSKAFQDTAFDVDAWLEEAPYENVFDFESDEEGPHHPHPPPHGKPPHDGPPHDGPPHRKPPHRKPPSHKRPHHPPHHGKPNLTVYELISKSKYTTKLAKLVEEDEVLVKILNSTEANITLFAPTDRAFDKIPKHAPKPSKEVIRKVLLYHIASGLYPAGRVLHSHTIPSLYNESTLGEDLPQRLAVKVGLRGLTINFFSRIVAVNILGTNGVIHGVDSIIIPPPDVLSIIGFLPGEFSTLTLGLTKTGLLEELNKTAHTGSTFFAPSNFAFKKLGPKINGFLFSKWGEKYLKALLQYHVVLNETLYSDAFYSSDSIDGERRSEMTPCRHAMEKKVTRRGPPVHFHFDLPTLLEDRSLAVDVGRFGPFISIKINGFSRVAVQDGIAKDGVIQVVSNVLIPPKTAGKDGIDEKGIWMGEEMSVEEFKERLDPYVEEDEIADEWLEL